MKKIFSVFLQRSYSCQILDFFFKKQSLYIGGPLLFKNNYFFNSLFFPLMELLPQIQKVYKVFLFKSLELLLILVVSQKFSIKKKINMFLFFFFKLGLGLSKRTRKMDRGCTYERYRQQIKEKIQALSYKEFSALKTRGVL